MAASKLETEKVSANDETTPLLAASQAGPSAQANEEGAIPTTQQDEEEDRGPPLPRTQIFLLCFARLVEPIAFFSIFPFINKMISDTGEVPKSDVGFYSGLIESLFSLTQMILMLLWGRASDRYGRKPILVFSLSGVTIATALFGLSTKIWQMILFRCLAGVFAGTIVTIRTMISELSTPWTQARAFSIFAVAGNIGIFVGPLVGGALSNPVDQYPAVFGNILIFKDYPYLLPTLCTASISAIATITSLLFVKETLKRKETSGESTREIIKPMSTWEIIKAPGVVSVLYIYGHTILLGLAYTAIMPVCLFTAVKLGGIGFSPLQISIFMGAGGGMQAIWGLAVFPPLQHRIGTGGLMRIISYIWPISFALAPLSNVLLKKHWFAGFWTVVSVIIFLGSGVSMAFTAAQLALNDIAPAPGTLGTLNGVALSLISGIRAIAPALFASLYATGVRNHILNGYLGWLILIAFALGLTVGIRWLPAKAEGRLRKPRNPS